jgi:SAM-dependent methyltransferase
MGVLLYILTALAALFLLTLTPIGRGFRQWIMARIYTKVQTRYERHIAERKRILLDSLEGTVLEIGPGNGINFQYMPAKVERWIGIEPNPYMHNELRAAGAQHDVATEFRMLSTEGMVVEDESVDTVLSTLVLCSVPDARAVVRDIHRILRPGGRFVFVEHVAAPRGSGLRRLQGLLRPIWSYFADGCCPNRELAEAIRSADFAHVEIEEFHMPKEAVPSIVAPHIAGVAVKGP